MSDAAHLDRRDVVARLLADRGSLLVVAGLGAPAWDCTAAGDHPLTFPLWGGMGAAAMIGLGLAAAQPARRVLVVTGDGEMLMGLGSLATIGVQAPRNLAIVVLDNERYGETGMQATATAHGVDLAAAAAACRVRHAPPGRAAAGGGGSRPPTTVRTEPELAAALGPIRDAPGPLLYQVKVRADKLPLVLPPREGAHLKNRFREALLGARAFV
jgi:thiamine pyrophosphate-dependent acetolactate synthase large subunit-like protein